ncbi:MAG: hypothetical protein HS111_10425 [Kofleriaceae bacterium]|nr:hypothetical protein [Kofleriaceae bacterium]
MHELDPFGYLDEVLRVLPSWPREALPRARAPALARHSRPARSGRPQAPDRPPARAPTATSSGPRPRHAPDRRAP